MNMTLALVTLLLIIGGLAVGQTAVDSKETGFAGHDVLLPCPCSDEHNKLLWQKDEIVVNIYPQDEIDKDSIDQSYKDRTWLFQNKEKRNCSLLLLDLSVTDSGVYTCYPLVSVGEGIWTKKLFSVNLTVSDHNKTEHSEQARDQNGTKPDTNVSVGVLILIVMLILAVGLLLTLLIRRRHLKNTNTTSDSPSDPMIVCRQLA
ncbi:uncharacterized protein LOC127448524 [Myxocyprinus asiaticus]|uniref:uncharacterized protein LOC127448524 n=1 Tax=Myxocyprinus asiaticus TaxID=70543 RepID=UPI002223EA2E|nr:uncharacterized protein LOC127448524 [Myxocyprinus asiaticus]